MLFGRRSKKLSKEQQEKYELIDRVRHELLEAYKLIFDPDHWCRRALCRDAEGEQLFDPADERAVQWCLLGAIYKPENYSAETLTLVKNYGKLNGVNDLARFNDDSGHVEVLRFLEALLHNLGVKLTFFDADGKEIK